MSMQDYMANDIAALFKLDMPAQCKIGNVTYSVLLDDEINEELDTYGGPERVEMQRVFFLATDRKKIEDGTTLQVRADKRSSWTTKIVLSSVMSADGNNLIATVRGN